MGYVRSEHCISETIPQESDAYVFHPREIAFCGYSGAGKTTLIRGLLQQMSSRWHIGYVKHDAHRFSMDTKGKDTQVAHASGARTVCINDPTGWAAIVDGQPDAELLRMLYAPMDCVFVEGYKHSDIPKIVVVDREERILEDVRGGRVRNVCACVGQEKEMDADMALPWFFRDDSAGVAAFILRRWSLSTGGE